MAIPGLPQIAAAQPFNPAIQAFVNPLAQLGAISPFAALAAGNPVAALTALSPALNVVNPAVNPAATLLAFNPEAAPTLALTNPALAGTALSAALLGRSLMPFGIGMPFGLPFGIPGFGII